MKTTTGVTATQRRGGHQRVMSGFLLVGFNMQQFGKLSHRLDDFNDGAAGVNSSGAELTILGVKVAHNRS